jgi:hypothetical protein
MTEINNPIPNSELSVQVPGLELANTGDLSQKSAELNAVPISELKDAASIPLDEFPEFSDIFFEDDIDEFVAPQHEFNAEPDLLNELAQQQLAVGAPPTSLAVVNYTPLVWENYYMGFTHSEIVMNAIDACEKPNHRYQGTEINKKLEERGFQKSSQALSKNYNCKPSGYAYTKAKFESENREALGGFQLTSMLNTEKNGARSIWWSDFPRPLLERLPCQARPYTCMANLFCVPGLPDFPMTKVYSNKMYSEFLWDLVQLVQFEDLRWPGLKLQAILSSNLINSVVKLLRKQGLVDASFKFEDASRSIPAARHNGSRIFRVYKDAEKNANEIHYFAKPKHGVPIEQQVFTIFPSTKWRLAHGHTVLRHCLTYLATPVPDELCVCLRKPQSRDVDFNLDLLSPDMLAGFFAPDTTPSKQPEPVPQPIAIEQSVPQPTPVEQPEQNTPLPETSEHQSNELENHSDAMKETENSEEIPAPRPAGARQMHAEPSKDLGHLIAYYRANPNEIPKQHYDMDPAECKTDYDRMRCHQRATNAAVLAALGIQAKVASIRSQASKPAVEFEIRRERYETRHSNKKRTYEEAEESAPKRNKSSSSSDDDDVDFIF